MNCGIIRNTLTTTLALELEYREPVLDEWGIPMVCSLGGRNDFVLSEWQLHLGPIGSSVRFRLPVRSSRASGIRKTRMR